MVKKNRKLSTILAMDVVNYSSKMGEDDEGTLKLLAERRSIIEQHIKIHGGRIFNTAGDAFMIDFSSPIEAVKKEAAIWHEMTVIEEMMPVYLEYGLK
jgi:adenylate cyclase